MTTQEVPDIVAHALTHIGKVREENQDAVRVHTVDHEEHPREPLYGIADGMGGYEHGGVASVLALETFFETYLSRDGAPIPQRLREGVEMANLGVFQTARRIGAARMGTTLTAVAVAGRTLHVAHVGDSRAYLIRGREATCLTNDHTRVGELVRMKLLSPDKVRGHQQRSILSRCLGLQLFVQPDIGAHRVQDGDLVILCTDGVWSVIEDAEFAALAAEAPGPEHLNQRIFELAMERDSDDNLSVLSVWLRHLAPGHGPSEPPLLGRLFSRLIRRGSGT